MPKVGKQVVEWDTCDIAKAHAEYLKETVPMIKINYSNWQAFRFKGRRFLALIAKDGNTHIFGAGFDNYGSWFSIDSFREHYARDGEKLNLDPITAATEGGA